MGSKKELVYSDETLDDLILGDFKLIQAVQGYRFSLDAVLLAHFPVLGGVRNVVDFGTGSGVIPILLATRSPSITVTGLELQESMVDRANRTINYNGLVEKIKIINGGINNVNDIFPANYTDLVVTNPPFWKKGEGKISQNEEEAIARHEISLDLPTLIAAGAYVLRQGGNMCIIHRADRLSEIINIYEKNKLHLKRLRTIHTFCDREAKLVLVEGQKNGGGSFTILPPLIIYKKPGEYCDELQQLYQVD
ncbi:MAG: tRNA1(Val) (adenine(37)-N6)-methyltransferase [Syntrophomonadaceae bacterium]|nr:tRNA1(Val) (adenine(37)-N6)-methyltransferase [Syntrophomonadaceae bacterium]